MMMMNISMSRRATTTCYALLKVLLVASLAFVVSSANVNVNVKNGMGNTNTMPEDDKDVKRKLTGEDNTHIYTKTYIAVTKAANFVRLFPNGGDIVSFLDDFITKARAAFLSGGPPFKSNPEFLIQGSSTTQKGAVFDSSSINFVNAPDGVEVDLVKTGQFSIRAQFAGDRKLQFTPIDDPFYFFHGQCTATSGILEPSTDILLLLDSSIPITIPQPVITSQSCSLSLCLGGGGFSCIAIYSGSSFVFNVGKGIVLNNGSTLGSSTPLTFEAPPLPPPFPGTIIGGTGAFEGIEGSVTVTTIAGTTGPILGFSSTEVAGFVFGNEIGSIVQAITVKSNMPLPTGP